MVPEIKQRTKEDVKKAYKKNKVNERDQRRR